MMKEFGESERGKESAVCEPREGEKKVNNLPQNLQNGAMRNKDKEQKEDIKGNPRCYMDRTRRHRQ